MNPVKLHEFWRFFFSEVCLFYSLFPSLLLLFGLFKWIHENILVVLMNKKRVSSVTHSLERELELCQVIHYVHPKKGNTGFTECASSLVVAFCEFILIKMFHLLDTHTILSMAIWLDVGSSHTQTPQGFYPRIHALKHAIQTKTTKVNLKSSAFSLRNYETLPQRIHPENFQKP